MGVCCFIGHRKIEKTDELSKVLSMIIENLITKKNVSIYLFGSRSEFNSLCYDIVSNLKNKHKYIKRIYVRGEYHYVDDKKYFLEGYEDTYLSKSCKVASRASYIERNYDMIDSSDYCIFYYDKDYFAKRSKSGTRLAFEYAKRKGKEIINVYKKQPIL